MQVIDPGTGNLIDSGKYVSVKYTGTSFSGKMFDSNIDTSFHHTEPISFVVGTGQMVKGFDESVMFMRLGTRARVYIPSMLAYGGNPGTQLIKPYEHIMFDMTVTDVQNESPKQKNLEQQKEKLDKAQSKKTN